MSTATITWTAPTLRVDGSSIDPSDLLSVALFDGAVLIGTVPGQAPGSAGSFTTAALLVGMHSFTAVVTDSEGHASAASNAAVVTVVATLANPSPITDLAATLNP